MNTQLEKRLLIITDEYTLDQPQSIKWRVFHCTHYMLGGLLFITGSCIYFPLIINQNFNSPNGGGWLFTIGSFFFLLADIQEWYSYRIGYYFKKYRTVYETIDDDLIHYSNNTPRGKYEQAITELNLFMSVCGSALYLTGSIFFLQMFAKYLIIGEWLFIIGSAVIYISQCWKLWRSGCTNVHNRQDQTFSIYNLLNNIPTFGVDFFAAIGGIFYFMGTVLYLPTFNKSDWDEPRVSRLFVAGGICFTISGLCLIYRYYSTRQL
ncbi:unnamed protein product [Didymodactylos carnosus]|uniref:YrhK domain-containing protein n=1 Tax=Didymodactylos carnosus TaxID=1234261 RepID=A0A815K642_9BILA|nr:unnamed protein product [Didymodactylos carnosus]CAF4283806.1 unnamed protein product [Didymodactylos carnosus]